MANELAVLCQLTIYPTALIRASEVCSTRDTEIRSRRSDNARQRLILFVALARCSEAERGHSLGQQRVGPMKMASTDPPTTAPLFFI